MQKKQEKFIIFYIDLNMNKLLIVGSMAFDAIETPFGKTDRIIGGAAPYIALASAFFKTFPAVVSVVGNDYPEQYLNDLKSKDINLSGVEILKNVKTMFWSGRYNKDMNQRETLVTELNALNDFKPVVPEDYRDADIVMLGNLQPQVQLSVISQMKKRPKLIIMDTMNFWMTNTPDELEEVINKVDVLTINDEEARLLSGEYSLVAAAEKIFKKGLRYLIIKKGDNGALLFSKQGKKFFAPALPMSSVCDPTGAGDSFAGGFAGYIASKAQTDFETVKSAVIAGSVMGSFACESFGTQNLFKIDQSMFKKRVEEFVELSKFSF